MVRISRMTKLEEARALYKSKIEDGWQYVEDPPWMICENESCGSDKIYFLKKGNQLRYVCSECARWSDPVKHSKKRVIRPDQKNFRENVLKMYNGRCVICGIQATEAHHIIPVSVGHKIGLQEYWLWSIGNGVALCKSCHAIWHEASYETERKLHFARKKANGEQ